MAAVKLLPDESHATANVCLLAHLQKLSTAALGEPDGGVQIFVATGVSSFKLYEIVLVLLNARFGIQ